MHVHSGRAKMNVAHCPDYVRTEVHPREVQGIDAEVKQCASAKLRLHDPFLELHHVAERSGQSTWLADDAAFHEFLDFMRKRHVPCPYGFRDEDAFLACCADKDLSFLRIGCECLFHEYRLAVFESKHRVLEVVGVRSRYVYEVDLRVSDQLLIASVRLLYISFLCELLRLLD